MSSICFFLMDCTSLSCVPCLSPIDYLQFVYNSCPVIFFSLTASFFTASFTSCIDLHWA